MEEIHRIPRAPAPIIVPVSQIDDPQILVAIGREGGQSTGYVIIQEHNDPEPHVHVVAWAAGIGTLQSLLRVN